MTAAIADGGGAVAHDESSPFVLARRHLSPGQALAMRMAGGGALEHRADGATVVRTDGRPLVDFGSYGVTLVGHRHPTVLARVRDELERMPSSTRSLGNETTIRFAAELVAALGAPELTRAWLGCTGADAVDAATKLARLATSRRLVLAVEGAFHGKTQGVGPFTHGARHRLLPGAPGSSADVRHLDPSDPGAAARVVATEEVAALLFEPVQGEGGARALDPAVLRRWATDVRAAGGFVISDEVQCGLLRCGAMSVARAEGIPVDAVLFGKGLGGGVAPLSAVVGRDALFATVLADPFAHTSTFSGHPLACAAGRGVLEVLAASAPAVDRLVADVAARCADLAAASPVVRRVTGRGLLVGLELTTPAAAGEVLVEAAERGLVLSPCLSRPSTIRLLPPIVATPADLDAAFDALRAACAVAATRPEGTP